MGDVAMATGEINTQMIRLLSCLEHMKTGQKLFVGNLREETKRANRRTVAHYKKARETIHGTCSTLASGMSFPMSSFVYSNRLSTSIIRRVEYQRKVTNLSSTLWTRR